MSEKPLRRKYGTVILLDALGASEYSDTKIREFLRARTEINLIVSQVAKEIPKFPLPTIFTFGDTIIITVELRTKKYIRAHMIGIALLIRRYLFHSLLHRIEFRGAFSIGTYIEDSRSNTVLGGSGTGCCLLA